MPHKGPKGQKMSIQKALALWLIAVTLGTAALIPRHVAAEGITLVDIPRIAENVVKGVKEVASSAVKASVATMLINLMTFAADRAAYDAAVLISSGGNAEEPLYDQTPIEAYFVEVGKAVAGKAIDELQTQIDGAGGLLTNFNLCAPRTPEILLSFQFGIKSQFDRPVPKCEVNKLVENWDGFLSEVKSGAEGGVFRNQLILTELANAYNPDVNEFNVGLQLTADILGKSQSEAETAKEDRIANGPFKGIVNAITGNIETPNTLIAADFIKKTEASAEVREKISIQMLGSDGLLLSIGKHAGSIFANTLLSELTQRLYNGLFDFEDVPQDPFNPDSFARGNADDARDTYRSFLSAVPLEITNYSILSDFGSCPAENRGLYNCVASDSLVSAVARAETGAPMTLQEAMEDGLIDPNWPLIPSSDHARDQDPYCYTYGFCHSNLVKLRKARIISIGWELAADSAYNTTGSPHTLKEIMNGFNSCNGAGEIDEDHPWCKLIDPTWILKYPDTQCRAQVYGQLLESSASDQRMEECVDMPSCIAEDDNGTCTGGYGYCVREENVWRFRGESCPEEYASCITVQSDEKTASYLRNTTDPGPCSADNAGCLWYATEKVQQGDGSFDWPVIANIATADAAADANESRIYLTNAVEECDEDEGGCRELIERTDTLRLNMVVNPSFEDDQDNNTQPDGWLFTSGGDALYDQGTYSRTGDGSVIANEDDITQSGLVFSQSRFYTLSYYARQEGGGSADGDVSISFISDDGSAVNLVGTSMTSDCVLIGTNTISLSLQPDGTDYERVSCTFTSPTQADSSAKIIGTLSLDGGIYIDDVQIEQGEDASGYHEGYTTASVSTLTVKVPPSYLGCTGGADDPEECDGYAKVCTENDVGCSLYAPANGDPSVTGVANAADYCPSACVGYDSYKQEPTLYEPSGNFPVYFIPDTAEKCTEEEVGCDEFTDLTTEGKNYFTYVRACVTEAQADANISSDNGAVFYTWEGSDRDGYQLKTWNLLESNLAVSKYAYASSGETDAEPGSAPCVNWNATENGVACDDDLDADGDLVYDWDVSSCDEHDDIFTNPDCREFYDAEGGIHYREWSKTVTVDDACSAYRKTAIVGDDATEQRDNCEESGGYFDDTGSCRYYGFASESTTCTEKANGCRSYTGGRSRNSRVAFEDTVESGDLNKWDAESASTITYSNESLATDGHSIFASDAIQTFVYDNGSECASGDDCSGSAFALGGECTVGIGDRYCGTLEDELFQGKTYTLSFWAKGTGTLEAGFNRAAEGTSVDLDISFGEVDLESGWQQFSVGPLAMTEDEYAGFGSGTTLVFSPSSSAYIDNITLREGEDNITLIKDSWVTPAACDETPEGGASPQYYLGCQEYRDQDGDSVNLKSFSKLCSEDKVGCEDFFMTEESTSPYAEVHNAICSLPGGGVATSATACYYSVTGGSFDTTSPYLCTIGVGEAVCDFDLEWYVDSSALPAHISYEASTKIVPADRDVFLVVNDQVTCSSGTAGCEEVGNILWEQDKSGTTGAESIYLMNDPDAYDEILCTANELFCEEWTGAAGTNYYFKDPGDKTCEYKTDVTVGGSTYSGWFKTGTSQLCYSDYVVGGDFAGVWKNGDTGFDGWAGTCSVQYDGCSEFQDLLDVPEDNLYGDGSSESYFYLSNANLDENSLPSSQKCDGRVSLKNGCALFNDTGNSAESYQSSATEMASRHADVLFNTVQFDLVDPIDCESGNSVIEGTSIDLCASRCIYSDALVDDITNDGAGGYSYGTSCYEAADCAPVKSESGDMIDASDCGATAPDGEVVPRLENDTNTVLKVNRDRQCSEWLSCAGTNTVWDERTNSYRTICDDIELCTEYSSLGNSSFCSEWKTEDPEVVLDEDRYTARDITWYGDDYSGYAIPDMFPVQTLTQANIAAPAGICDLTARYAAGQVSEGTYAANQGSECISDFECGSDIDSKTMPGSCTTGEEDAEYRLVLNAGNCEEDYGQTCSIGSCSETGAACSTDSQCGSSGGSCVVGTCYDIDETRSCNKNSQCGSGVCIGNVCATREEEVNADSYEPRNPDASCAGFATRGSSFVEDIDFKNGTCINSECLLAPNGEQFIAGDTESKVCRAYPEVNSPFSSDLVDEWYDTDTSSKRNVNDPVTWDDTAYNTRSGFENAQFCAPGEDCACTYKKITFGQGGIVRYADDSFTMADVEKGDDTGKLGICTTGEYLGKLCDTAEECGTEGGTCTQPSREDTLLGMDGYCLERDTGININGDREEGACITWLPVDQLAGSTDLYGKFTEAGFSTEANYCSYMSLYADVGTGSGCVERDGGLSSVEASCVNVATTCAPGTYAVIGPYMDSANKGVDTLVDSCAAGGVGTDNDCGYICVPLGAIVEGDASSPLSGESCDPGNAGGIIDLGEDKGMIDRGEYDFQAFFIEDAAEFKTAREALDNCIARGRKFFVPTNAEADDGSSLNPLKLTSFGMRMHSEDIACGGDRCGWHSFDSYSSDGTFNAYMACEELAQLQDTGSFDGAPWTDRLLNPDSGYALTTASSYPEFKYTSLLPRELYGIAPEVAALNSRKYPAVVVQCDGPTSGSKEKFYAVDSTTASVDCPEGYAVNVKPQDSLPFADFSGSQLLRGYVTDADLVFNKVGEAARGVKDLLSQLFARSLSLVTYDDGRSAGTGLGSVTLAEGEQKVSEGASESDEDVWDVRETEGNPPKVWSIDQTTCAGTECEEGTEGAITINEADSGDQSSKSFFRAYTKFYAAADKNQLPLRRVIVDWGDDTDPSGSSDDENFYKNHRGLQNGTTLSKCEAGTEWGMTDESCDPNYFSYSHVYTCPSSLQLSTDPNDRCRDDDGDGNLDVSPCVTNARTTEATCSYQPRVHVRDNWGWCGGTCDGEEGCYDKDGDIGTTTLLGSLTDQCAYKSFPENNASLDPWVYYDGIITVDP